IATESVPEVGTAVLAIGAPEGPAGKDLPFTVTKGIVSALREWQGTHYLQTDAALNHGNSGGPILSPDGKVVAIVSWKIAAPDVEGLSFGVPIYAIADRLAISWQ
ncbi:MAG: trypsin-like peptidase domain-containing protein, partial [Candidatus Brocadiia bacterium]|nr:trypsin-like peptidase domain-containing protein [Candidatus Brocadiia bacterium]